MPKPNKWVTFPAVHVCQYRNISFHIFGLDGFIENHHQNNIAKQIIVRDVNDSSDKFFFLVSHWLISMCLSCVAWLDGSEFMNYFVISDKPDVLNCSHPSSLSCGKHQVISHFISFFSYSQFGYNGCHVYWVHRNWFERLCVCVCVVAVSHTIFLVFGADETVLRNYPFDLSHIFIEIERNLNEWGRRNKSGEDEVCTKPKKNILNDFRLWAHTHTHTNI